MPEAQGTFLGRPICAVVVGTTVRVDGPTSGDLEFLERILASLSVTLREAEKRLAEYEESTGPEYTAHVANPHIWIRDDRDTPQEWTFVVERDDWPGYGWHVEFKDSTFVELWAGD